MLFYHKVKKISISFLRLKEIFGFIFLIILVSLIYFILITLLSTFLLSEKKRKKSFGFIFLIILVSLIYFILIIFYQLFFCLKRKVAKESRFKGKGISIPFPLKNPLFLNDQRVSDPLESFSRRHNASAVLCGFAFSSNGCFV